MAGFYWENYFFESRFINFKRGGVLLFYPSPMGGSTISGSFTLQRIVGTSFWSTTLLSRTHFTEEKSDVSLEFHSVLAFIVYLGSSNWISKCWSQCGTGLVQVFVQIGYIFSAFWGNFLLLRRACWIRSENAASFLRGTKAFLKQIQNFSLWIR